MTGTEVLDVARDAILTLVLVSSPLMLVGLLVGVLISLFQALTQIQEMTLVFVPKILAIFLVMLIGLVVGVVISLFQALTQIQEMTLVFVPKILAIFVAMLIALPFMADLLQAYMLRLASHIVGG